MSSNFYNDCLKIAVAQICQNVGFKGIYSVPMDVLVHLLHCYLKEIGTSTHQYAEHFGRTEPNLDDLGLTFNDIGVKIGELEEFVQYVEPSPFPVQIPNLPIPMPTNLNFLKPGAREILTRPVHVHDHLPPMYPEREEEEIEHDSSISIDRNNEKDYEENVEVGDGHGSPRRPYDSTDSISPQTKKIKTFDPSDGEPYREIESVMMTTSGFISSGREGKMPEARRCTIPIESNRHSHSKVHFSNFASKKSSNENSNPELNKVVGQHLQQPNILEHVSKPNMSQTLPMITPDKPKPRPFIPTPELKIPIPKNPIPKPKSIVEDDGSKVEKEKKSVEKVRVKSKKHRREEKRLNKEGKKEHRSSKEKRIKSKDHKDGKEKKIKHSKDGIDRKLKHSKDGKRSDKKSKHSTNSDDKDGKKSRHDKDKKKIRKDGEHKSKKNKPPKEEIVASKVDVIEDEHVEVEKVIESKTPEKEKEKEKDKDKPTIKVTSEKNLLSKEEKERRLMLERQEKDRKRREMRIRQKGLSKEEELRRYKKREMELLAALALSAPNNIKSGAFKAKDLIKTERILMNRSPDRSLSPDFPWLSGGSLFDGPSSSHHSPITIKKEIEDPSYNGKEECKVRVKDPFKLLNPDEIKKEKDVEFPSSHENEQSRIHKLNVDLSLDSDQDMSFQEIPSTPITPDIHDASLISSTSEKASLNDLDAHNSSLDESNHTFLLSDSSINITNSIDVATPSPPVQSTPPIKKKRGRKSRLEKSGVKAKKEKREKSNDSAQDAITLSVARIIESVSRIPDVQEGPSLIPSFSEFSFPPSDDNPSDVSFSSPKKQPESPKEEFVKVKLPLKLEDKSKEKRKEHKREKKDKMKEKVKDKDKQKRKKEKKSKDKERKEKESSKPEEKERKRGRKRKDANVQNLMVEVQADEKSGDQFSSEVKTTPKLVIKPVIKREESPPIRKSPNIEEVGSPIDEPKSPEIAKFAALITRPPKSSRGRPDGSVSLTVPPLKLTKEISTDSNKLFAPVKHVDSPMSTSEVLPKLKIRTQSNQHKIDLSANLSPVSGEKRKRGRPKKLNPPLLSPTVKSEPVVPVVVPNIETRSAILPIPIPTAEHGESRPIRFQPGARPSKSKVSATSGLVTETVGPIGHFLDDQGAEVWICPTCGRQDDGSPMIGCDTCDDWYHWLCVGLQVPPSETEKWFCPRCLSQHRQNDVSSPPKKKRGRKRKMNLLDVSNLE